MRVLFYGLLATGSYIFQAFGLSDVSLTDFQGSLDSDFKSHARLERNFYRLNSCVPFVDYSNLSIKNCLKSIYAPQGTLRKIDITQLKKTSSNKVICNYSVGNSSSTFRKFDGTLTRIHPGLLKNNNAFQKISNNRLTFNFDNIEIGAYLNLAQENQKNYGINKIVRKTFTGLQAQLPRIGNLSNSLKLDRNFSKTQITEISENILGWHFSGQALGSRYQGLVQKKQVYIQNQPSSTVSTNYSLILSKELLKNLHGNVGYMYSNISSPQANPTAIKSMHVAVDRIFLNLFKSGIQYELKEKAFDQGESFKAYVMTHTQQPIAVKVSVGLLKDNGKDQQTYDFQLLYSKDLVSF